MKLLSERTKRAFTLIEMTAITGMLMVGTSLALPHFARAKDRCQHVNCANNLKQIGVAFHTWALDYGGKFPMQVPITNGGTLELAGSGVVFPHFEVMSNELSTPKILFCPEESNAERKVANTFGRTISPGSIGKVPFASDTNLSYFVGVNAVDGDSRMMLCGDDNFTFERMRLRHRLVPILTNSTVEWTAETHAGKGNMCFADGHVQQLNTANLNKAIQQSQLRNQLAMP
jgi:prepilin-type processing-associated H-X9-DG protein